MLKLEYSDYKQLFESCKEEVGRTPFFSLRLEHLGNLALPEEAFELVLFGIRSGERGGDIYSLYRDTISILRINKDLKPEIYEFSAATESLEDQIEDQNPDGDFRLDPGVYWFKHDLYKGKYPCLAQAGPVCGKRARKGLPYGGHYELTECINIRAGATRPDNPSSWISGSQVISGGWGGAAWHAFYSTCVASRQKVFPYLLLDESRLYEILDNKKKEEEGSQLCQTQSSSY